MRFRIQIADLIFAINSQYEMIQEYCKEYCVPERTPDFDLTISHLDIEAEKTVEINDISEFPYLETVAGLRKIAELLPLRNRLLFHGAAITYKDCGAYLFTAPSGTGKSTHISLWRKYLKKNVDIINGDKPVVSISNENMQIYGTPWAGKEGWQKNRNAKLQAICFVERGTNISIRKLEKTEAFNKLLQQTYMPKDRIAIKNTFELMEILLEKVPVYLLSCDISEDAVKCSFEKLSGLDYENEKNGAELL